MSAVPVVLLNNQLVQASSVTPWLDNRAFRFGDGVFETIRVISGTPRFVSGHYKRLMNGVRVLGIDLPEWFEEKHFEQQLAALCLKNKIFENAKIRYQVYRGGSGAYAPTQDEANFYAEVTPLAATYALDAVQKLAVYEGIRLSFSAISAIKTCNGLPYILAAKYARQQGYHNGLLISQSGNYAEASNANLFVVYAGELYTPPIAEGIIPGIMRQQVIHIAHNIGLQLHETPISPKLMHQAHEVFTTNVVTGLQPIRFIKGFERTYPINGEVLTKLFKTLMQQL